MLKFSENTIGQLKIWAIVGAVLPIVFLACLFFISIFGLEETYQKALVVGATLMFAMASLWWWWVIRTIFNITKILSRTLDRFDHVKEDLSEIKNEVKKII